MNPIISLVFCLLVSVTTALYNAPGTRLSTGNVRWGGNTWSESNIHPSLLKHDIFGNDGIHRYPGSNYYPNNINSWGSSNSFFPRHSIRTHRLNGRRYKRSLYRSPYSNSGKQFGLNRDSHFNQQQLLNSHDIIGNQQLFNNNHLNNQHLIDSQQLLNNQHLLGNQNLLGNQHLLAGNQHLFGNQHVLGNQQPWDLQNNLQFFGNQQIGGGIRRDIFPRRRY